ncbi:MAG: AI-2E family transporter [Deltaproteobacteria bacterium]|nr:AI-2E family transporter [Deltaproteobacteria bacterium]
MSDTKAEGERFRLSFLILLVAAISAAFIAMIWDFVTPLLLAAIFTGLCRPVHQKLTQWLGGRVALASAVTLLLILFLLIAPMIVFLGVVAGQAVEVTDTIRPWIQERMAANPAGELENPIRLPDFLEPYESQIYSKAGQITSSVGQFLFQTLAALTRGTVSFLFALFIMLYSMFFFLRDGHGILTKILYYIPLRSEDELRMVNKFVTVTKATLKGSLVIGIVQGALAGAAFGVIGIQGAAFWGTVMAVLSIIPGIGTALVWVPAAIWLFANGQTVEAAGLTIWCTAVVGTVDNILRPRLVGRDTQMSDLLIMLSTLGGLLLFGATGLVVGPIMAALFVTVWEIYGQAFSAYLPHVDPSEVPGEIAKAQTKSD